MSETTKTQIENLEAAIATATANIKKADKLGLTHVAQQTRRDRKRYRIELEALTGECADCIERDMLGLEPTHAHAA
jgi:hypothetical protein